MSSQVNNLVSLPIDVFTIITSDFDLADLCSLRLTSHNLHAIANTANFQARFQHTRTDLSLANLQALVAVCSSSDFGHLIKEITVLAKHYDDRELCQQLKEGTIWKADPGNGPIFSSSGHYMTDDEKAEAKAMFVRMTELKNDQAALWDSGTDVKLLSEAFKRLGARSVDLSIEAAVHVRPQGPRLPIVNCRDHEGMTQRMDHTFKITIAALSNSQLQISNLNVFEMRWGGYVSMKGLYEALQYTASTVASDSPALSSPPALHRIQCLSLSLHAASTKTIPEDQLDYSRESKYPVRYKPASTLALHAVFLHSLAALIHPAATSMTHLDIRFRGFHTLMLDCAKTFSHLASPNVSFPNLSTLNLHNILIHNTDLLSLLRATPSLKHLGLHKVSLPHDPTHPRQRIEYHSTSPGWVQVEPMVPSWRYAWKVVFDALATPASPDRPISTTTSTNDNNVPTIPCPNLETLTVNSLYLTSFEHRIYFTHPFGALKRYVHSIVDNEEGKQREWFKPQAFHEGLACCVFTGQEVRGQPDGRSRGEGTNPPTPTDTAAAYEHPDLGNGLYIPLPSPPPVFPAAGPSETGNIALAASAGESAWRGIQYKVATTRPYGSPAYYQWLHHWEAREFGVSGCAPELGTTEGEKSGEGNRLIKSNISDRGFDGK